MLDFFLVCFCNCFLLLLVVYCSFVFVYWLKLDKCVFQEDLLLESGEYFLSDTKKFAKKWQEKQEKQAEKTAEKKRKREEAFIPPKVWFQAYLHMIIVIYLSKFVFLLLSLDALGTVKEVSISGFN